MQQENEIIFTRKNISNLFVPGDNRGKSHGMNRFRTPPDIQTWAKCIGGLVINFGAIEDLSYLWMGELAGEAAERKARKMFLSERINEIIRLLSMSTLAPDARKKAFKLWKEIKKLSVNRNRIVHNPINFGYIAETGQSILSIHDLQKVKGRTGGKYKLLSSQQIKDDAIRIGEIANELELIIPTTRRV